MKLNNTSYTNRKYLSYRIGIIFPIRTGNILLTKYIRGNTYNEAGFDCLFSLAFEKARARDSLATISSSSKLNFYPLSLLSVLEFLIIIKNCAYGRWYI